MLPFTFTAESRNISSAPFPLLAHLRQCEGYPWSLRATPNIAFALDWVKPDQADRMFAPEEMNCPI